MKYAERVLKIKDGRGINISEATANDAEEILAYMDIVGAESDNLFVEEGTKSFTLEGERNFLRAQENNESALMLIAKCDGELAAMGDIHIVTTRPRGRHRASFGITAKKAFWGQGIAKAVIEELIAFARGIGAEIIELEVKVDNTRGIGLYKHLGFKIMATHKAFFKINGEYTDAYIMQKYI